MKKNKLTSVCQNILMVCGVITAMTGAAAGIKDTFFSSKHEEVSNNGNDKTIIIERHIIEKGADKGEIKSKHPAPQSIRVPIQTVELPVPASVSASEGDSVLDEITAARATSQSVQSMAPSWFDRMISSWIAIMFTGITIVGGILMLEMYVWKHKENKTEGNIE